MPDSGAARALPPGGAAYRPGTPQPASPREPRRPAPHPAPRPASRGATRRAERSPLPLIVITALLVAVNIMGWPYYVLPMAKRVRSPLHPWLRPSGYVGQSAGILALAIFVFLWLYPLRKKYRWLAFTGTVGKWLDVHITTALALPLLLAIHAAWRFDGLIGLGYTAMLVVCASGVVGRYLYVRIPRSASGLELTRDEVAGQRAALVEQIARRTGLEVAAVEAALAPIRQGAERGGIGRIFVSLLTDDLSRWRQVRELRRRWSRLGAGRRPLDKRTLDEIVRLARREIALQQQVRMLQATHRVFGYWHVAHRPVAVTALVAVVVHVAVVVALGATWFW